MTKAITNADFEKNVLQNDKVVLVDFWAPWCGPCQMLSPIIDDLAKELEDKAMVYKVNVDEEGELASRYGVMSIPTIKIFKRGEAVDEAVGTQTREQLLELIEKYQ